jgi:hypothetical protein
MDERHRVARLRELAAEIEQLPPGEARDALLWDVRSRAVAVETGTEQARRSTSRPSPPSDRDLLGNLRRTS